MALRLLLVSAVASLGLTLPAEGEVQTWTSTARIWVSARMAQWDACCVSEGESTVLASRLGSSEAGERARANLALRADMEEAVRSFSAGCPTAPVCKERVTTQAAPTFEPMAIGDDLYTGMAHALNRASEGLNVSRLAIGEREVPADSRSMAVVEETPADVTRSSGRGEGKPYGRLAEASGRSEVRYELMVVGDDLYLGMAYALNRASEGFDLTSEGFISQEPAAASRVSQLSVALRLTREAVYAWSNLLHGPAVVAISR